MRSVIPNSLIFMLSELSLLSYSWGCLEMNAPEGVVFGQSVRISSSTTETHLREVRRREVKSCIPLTYVLNHISESAARYYVLIANR